jgi:hypothetical protein
MQGARNQGFLAMYSGNANGAYPPFGGGLVFSQNFSGGSAEMDVFNSSPTTGAYANSGIRFLQQSAARAANDLMFLKNSGSVSINGGSAGWASPAHTLDVGGDVSGSAFVSTGKQGAITGSCGKLSGIAGKATVGSFITNLTGTCSPVIALPTEHFWVCHASNLNHPANIITQSMATTSSAGFVGTTVGGDTIAWACQAW